MRHAQHGADADAVIIGSGAAGLLAGLTLVRRRPGTRVLLVEAGAALADRHPTDALYMEGYGGAGLFLGGRLYLGDATIPLQPPGAAPTELRPLLSGAAYAAEARAVNDLFSTFGAEGTLLPAPAEALATAIAAAASVGLEYVTSYPSRYLAAAERERVLRGLRAAIEAEGGRFAFRTRALHVEAAPGGFALRLAPEAGEAYTLRARAVLLAPGRYGAEWLTEVARGLGARVLPLPATFGVRLEMPAAAYAPLTDVNPDPRLQRLVGGDALLKTYATCPGGLVEPIRRYGTVVATGVPLARERRTDRTTVAILVQPGAAGATGAWRGGDELAHHLNARAADRILVQRLADVRARQATTAEALASNAVQPTCPQAVPGAFRDLYPPAYWHAFEDFLQRLRHLAPAVGSDDTLLYAPVQERFWHLPTDAGLQTSVPGCFVAGDAANHSQGIIQAGVAGRLAGSGLAAYLDGQAAPSDAAG